MIWDYRRVRQPLVFPCHSCPEEDWVPALLCRLQEMKRHKERLFPAAPDWWHSGDTGWGQVVLLFGCEEWLLAGGSTPGRQAEDCILDRPRALSVHSHALWTLQRSSDIWEVNGDLMRPHKSCLVYLDNVIVIGFTFQEHLLNLQKVFQQSWEAHLKFDLEKWQLFENEVWYLKGIVSTEGLITNPKKLRAVQEWPISKNKHEIRYFLGLCFYYRWFISGFANIAKRLTKLSEEKQGFHWTRRSGGHLSIAKGALCTAPVLAYPQPRERFVVSTGTSNI
jgi:hypothetical protein